MNKTQKKIFVALIISTALMFASIFSASPKVLGIGMLQYAAVVFFSMFHNLRGRFQWSNFVDYNFSTAGEHFKNKRYGKSLVYTVVSPMLVLGGLIIFLMLFSKLFLE